MGRENIHGALEVVGDGGEVDLTGCLCDSAPSHPAQAITSFPCSEDFLDPAAHPVDWLVPVLELLECLGFVAAPHAGGDNARRPAFGADRIAEVVAPVSAVREDFAGIFRQCIRACPAIVDIGGCDGDLFDNCRVGIGADMGFEAVNGWLALVLDPARVAILLTGRGDNRSIDQRSGLDRNRLGFELRGHRLEQQAIEALRHQRFTEADKGRALGRRLGAGETGLS